ncbi:hypothetical protein pipiens_009810 [Culex pipiens pipiens]|uniref:Uncharacterized protein n=1 Tax=Culex pipiens pipiens TaxID=38569 RepID=A0ABD1DCJ3_CULPP
MAAPSSSAAGPLPASRSHDIVDSGSRQPSHSNSIRSNSTKATVHINGVAVDHFQQNSDVDEDVAALGGSCQNSDIRGFISYSSDSSMIELNLKFRKCACNENIINISKENLQQQQQQKEVEGQHRTTTTTATSSTFSKEGNSKKLLQLNKDNLNSLIVSDRQVKCETKLVVDQEAVSGAGAGAAVDSDDGEDPPNGRTLKVVGSPSKAASWSPSPLSTSPSPRAIAAEDLNRLQRRHSENVERRSIGIQHGLRPSVQRKKHQLRRGKTQAEEIIIISDEFRRQSLSDQKVRISRGASKKAISKSMESIEDKTPPNGKTVGVHLEEDTLTVVLDSAKSKSKSVDDISLGSNHNEEEFGPSTPLATSAAATNSVELVFISDEFVQRKSKTSSDVIVVVDANRRSSKRRKSASAALARNQLVIITDEADKKKPKDVRIVRSAKDPRRKTTISNSNSFLTYEEPFSPETLESKDIGTMFAEASEAAALAAAK